MPSFDIVSKTNLAEVDHALAGITREIATRFDFKGTRCTLERKDDTITVIADDDPLRQEVVIKQGIDKELSKVITKAVKDSKLKVQATLQGDEVRVSGKTRDDLQDAIVLVRKLPADRPLQFVNFRD